MPIKNEQSVQFEAVQVILGRLLDEGLKAYRKAADVDREILKNRANGFDVVRDPDLIRMKRKEAGNFPNRKFLYVESPDEAGEPVTGLWLRWDFTKSPYEFRIFLGHWSSIEDDRSFIAFRFDAPETGEEHNFFHCQPCRNFGDRDPMPKAARVSERFPTMALHATDIVELTICAIKALKGQKKTKSFLSNLIKDPAAAAHRSIQDTYTRHFGSQPPPAEKVMAVEGRGRR